MNHSQIESFNWGVADLIRDAFRRGRYQDVILPLTVLRRLDCVLAAKKEKVLARQAELRGKGVVQLIDVTSTEESIRFWQPMRKRLGDKRRENPSRRSWPRPPGKPA